MTQPADRRPKLAAALLGAATLALARVTASRLSLSTPSTLKITAIGEM